MKSLARTYFRGQVFFKFRASITAPQSSAMEKRAVIFLCCFQVPNDIVSSHYLTCCNVIGNLGINGFPFNCNVDQASAKPHSTWQKYWPKLALKFSQNVSIFYRPHPTQHSIFCDETETVLLEEKKCQLKSVLKRIPRTHWDRK